MPEKNLLIGKLVPPGHLQTETGAIPLYSCPKPATTLPEPSILPVPSGAEGQVALVEGLLDSGVLYSAEIVEVVPQVTGAILLDLLENGTIDLSLIKDHLARSKGGERPLKLCALVIGHKKTSPGAVNAALGLTEFAFNDDLARRIHQKTKSVKVQLFYRRTLETLPGDLNEIGPDFIVSLHCNAFNQRASGSEVLYYHQSPTGKRLAEILQQRLCACLGLPDRGIKPKTSEDRGGYLLRYSKAPCLIAEPFFIDNDLDLATAQENLDQLADAYAQAIEEMARIT